MANENGDERYKESMFALRQLHTGYGRVRRFDDTQGLDNSAVFSGSRDLSVLSR